MSISDRSAGGSRRHSYSSNPFTVMRSRILLLVVFLLLPMIVYFTVVNFLRGSTVFGLQNVTILALSLASILLLIGGRYGAAVTLLFVIGVPLVQIVFCVLAYVGGDVAVKLFQLASMNALIGVVLVGIFAEWRWQFLCSVCLLYAVLLVHTLQAVGSLDLGNHAFTGIMIYDLVGLFFVVFIFTSLQRLNRLTMERHRMAAQLSESLAARQRFFANMSHEIRNPLNGLLGAGSLMRQTELDDRQRDLLGLLEQNTAALNRMLSNILVHNQLTDHDREPQARLCDLPHLMEQLVSGFLGREYAGKIEIETDSLACRRIYSDPAALAQIVENLLDNALKFAGDAGPIRLGLSSSPGDGGDCRVTISVTDSGPGVDQEVRLVHLFHLERLARAVHGRVVH